MEDTARRDAEHAAPLHSRTPCHGCAKLLYVAIEIDSHLDDRYDRALVLITERVGVRRWKAVVREIRHALQEPHAEGLCGIYDRPAIARTSTGASARTPTRGGPPEGLETPDAFLAWFEKQRPKAFRRYRDFMKKKHRMAEKPELLRIGTTA
jgi:hypothetical protein